MLTPPKGVLMMLEEIQRWCDQQVTEDGLQSESWQGHAMTRLTDGRGGVVSWQQRFHRMLAPYRRMMSEVM